MQGEWVGNLVDEAAEGNEEALNRLLADVRPHVLAMAESRGVDRDLAEDVTQAVLLKLAQGIADLRRRDRFWPWLRRIAFNESTTCFRKERLARELATRVARELGPRAPSEPAHSIDGHRLRDVVLSLTPELTADQRIAVEWVCVQGYRPSEVAEETGLGRSTVRSSLCRGRRRLLRRMAEMHPGFTAELAATYSSTCS